MAEPDQPKKETVRIQSPVPSPPDPPQQTVNPRETVRIQSPLLPPANPPQQTVNPRETVRIQLPVRETGNPPVPSSPQSPPEDISSTDVVPPPKPPAASRPLPGSVRPPPVPPSLGPKKETVRIPLMPEPLRSAQKKTQPLIAMPDVVPQNPSIAVAPVEKSSMLLYWMLLGISALILIIQIWTYFS